MGSDGSRNLSDGGDMTDASRKTCFVVGPIGDAGSAVRGHADWLLDEIIAPVFSEHFNEFDVIRADRISSPGMIDSQVINHLLDAELVVADLSFQNANAFYEVGLRQAREFFYPLADLFSAPSQSLPCGVGFGQSGRREKPGGSPRTRPKPRTLAAYYSPAHSSVRNLCIRNKASQNESFATFSRSA